MYRCRHESETNRQLTTKWRGLERKQSCRLKAILTEMTTDWLFDSKI